MSDLDRIRMNQMFKEASEKYEENMNLVKTLNIMWGRLQPTNEEILELIKYFENKDQYEICQKLKSKLK